MVEMDNGHVQDFESKLSEALADMRSQHELQIKMYKEDVEKTYNSKVHHTFFVLGNTKKRHNTKHKLHTIMIQNIIKQECIELMRAGTTEAK